MQVPTIARDGSSHLVVSPPPATTSRRLSITFAASVFCLLLTSCPPAGAQAPREEIKKQMEGLKGTLEASGSGPAASTADEARRRIEEAGRRAKEDSEIRRMVEGKVGEAIAAKQTKEAVAPTAAPEAEATIDPRKLMSIDERRIAEAYDFSRWEGRYYAPLKRLEGLPSAVFKHLRGKAGGDVAALPSKEEITAYERTLPPPNGPSTRMRGFMSFSEAPGVRFPLKPGTGGSQPVDVANLPDCAEDRVEVRPSGYKGKAGQDVLNDVLHLRSSQRGSMPDNGFGRAQIIDYRPGAPSVEAYRDLSFGLRCLPWRMRVTRENVTIYEGREALKHYE